MKSWSMQCFYRCKNVLGRFNCDLRHYLVCHGSRLGSNKKETCTQKHYFYPIVISPGIQRQITPTSAFLRVCVKFFSRGTFTMVAPNSVDTSSTCTDLWDSFTFIDV